MFFGDFLADPMAVVHEIYERLGIELTPEAERACAASSTDNPQEKHGGHYYSFADTGLDAGALRERDASVSGVLRRSRRAAPLTLCRGHDGRR